MAWAHSQHLFLLPFLLFFTLTFPPIVRSLTENSELIAVEHERHSLGRHREGENAGEKVPMDFPEHLTITEGKSSKLHFEYRGDLDIKQLELTFDFNRTILKIVPEQIVLGPSPNNSAELEVTGLALSSRTYIDLKNCIILNGTTRQDCPFKKEDVFILAVVVKSPFISVLVIITGWVYFLAWSISFYPQILLNYQRKSVIGLNFDFLLLNVIGFACYTIYNVLLYFDPRVQDLYVARHGHRSLIPVLINDVVFAAHALFACIITAFQCFIYERGTQRISYTCRLWSTLLLCFSGVSLALSILRVLNWLDFINYLSYVKMAVTLSKYFPQAILNFKRKSTVGWSIGNVLLDFFGGSMDICQMVLQASNTDDYSAFTGNPVKFGLGLISIIFDVLFIIQHYVLYPHKALATYDQVTDEQRAPSPSTRTITLDNPNAAGETEPVVFP